VFLLCHCDSTGLADIDNTAEKRMNSRRLIANPGHAAAPPTSLMNSRRLIDPPVADEL
jgi:hypothetical protein